MSDTAFNSGQGSYFGFEMGDLKFGMFTACSGLSSELSVITQPATKEGGMKMESKQPDRRSYTEVVLKRGFTTDTALNDWFDKTVDAGEDVKRETGSIVVYTRKLDEIARFDLEACFPSKLSTSDLNAKSGEAMVEELTLRHEALLWP
jgi:phage tail-like protein